MSLWRKIALGAIDFMTEYTGTQLKNIERSAKSSGRSLNEHYYETKERYDNLKSNYDSRKQQMDD